MPKVSIKGESLDSCVMSIIKEENPQLYKYTTSQLKRYSSSDPDSLMKILEIIGLQTRIKSVEIDKASSKKHKIIALLQDGNYCMVKSADKETVEISSSKGGEEVLKVKTNKFNQDFYAGKVLILDNLQGEDGEQKTERVKNYFWFWDAIKSYRGFYTNVILAALMINIFSLIIPLFAMNVYDRVIPNYSSDTLWALASGVFLIIIFDFILKMLRSYFVENTSKKIDLKLSNSIFSKTLHLYMNNHADPVGVRANKIKEFDSIRDFLSSITLVGIIDFPFLIITIAIIYYIGGPLAMIPASALILAVLLTLILNKPLNKYTERYVEGSAKKSSLLFESLFNIETIKNLCAQPLIMRKWEEDCKLTSKAISKLRFFASFIVNATSSLGFISSVLTIIVGTHLIWSNNLTIGGLIACSILSGRCLAPIAQITTIITRFEQVKYSLKNLDDIMTLRDERKGIKEFYSIDKLGKNIEFHDVSFAYSDKSSDLFKSITFSIKEGEKVAILGNSGSGKSTTFKLITGLHTPTKGSISISGVNLQQIDPYILRSNIGYVEQNTKLFSGTLWNNIVLKNPKATEEDVLKVVQISGVDVFAKKHPDGYNMRIQEGGSNLSGGQIQSVALARALLSNPEIILLDEPTNFMDRKLEANFITKMKKFSEGKTLILSTHKHSLLTLVDRIIVLDNGKIVADNRKKTVIEEIKS